MPSPNTNLVNSKTIADIFGVDLRRVQQLAKEGIITATKEGHANRYDLLPTIQKYIRYLSDKANGRELPKRERDIEHRRLEAEARLKEAKAAIAMIQRQELEGQMHRSEDVEAVLTDLAFEIRSMITALPGRLAMDTAQIKTPEEEAIRIRDECNEILTTLASYQYNPDKFRRRVKERKGAEPVDESEE